MKLFEIRKLSETASGKLSVCVRYYCMLRLALTSILSTIYPQETISLGVGAIICFILCIIMDMLQYVYKTVLWDNFYQKKMSEQESDIPTENILVDESEGNYNAFTIWALWWAKLSFVLVGYLLYAILMLKILTSF